MKKSFLGVCVVALMLAFVACKDAKKAEAVVEETVVEAVDPAKVEPAVEAVKVAPADALKAFKEYAKSYGEAYNNIAKDPQKFSQLATQLQTQSAEIEKYKADFTPAQLKEYERALKIIIDANTGGTKK
ncbi:MAG: hypothetical protein LBN18_06245 [Dysgonamonadaceae bacterium]|jgi:septal ring factor EnvC (AmiA/AmiB activator)|nr:hypothetical protein [Dysgonamonadaceae bacterium]